MKIMEKISTWMENNLEQPLYQAEIARAEFVHGGNRRHNKRNSKGIIHGKVALRATK